MKRYYIFMVLLVVVTVVAVVAQSVLGRGVGADQKLAQRMSDFDTKVTDYANTNNVLPSASQLGGTPAGVIYQITGASTYKLCGTFATANNAPAGTDQPANYEYMDTTYHGKGYVCFEDDVTIAQPTPVGTPEPTPAKTPAPAATAHPSAGVGTGAAH